MANSPQSHANIGPLVIDWGDADEEARKAFKVLLDLASAKDARIRELEALATRLEVECQAYAQDAAAAEARCRKLEDALETAADNFDEIAEAIDGLASAEDRPLGTAELIRAVATEARALLDQADGEEGNG